MAAKLLKVCATWDEEANVWVAESDDVPGLVTGAPTSEELIEKLKVLVPELLELNRPADERNPVIELCSQKQERILLHA